jgi:hypothetical protein
MMRRGLALLVAAGLVASAAVLVQRVRLEQRHRAVEIVLDGEDWMMLIRREGREPAEALRALREAGAVSVALPDVTLERLSDDGTISYASGGDLLALARIAPLAGPFAHLHAAGLVRPDAVYVAGPHEQVDFVEMRMTALLGAERVRRVGDVVEARGTLLDLEELGLGFRPGDTLTVRAAGLDVVLRPRNNRGLSPESLRLLVDSYAAVAPEPTLIFALNEVQGHEDLVDDAAAEFQRIGARFGRIEAFAARRRQRGEEHLTALMRPSVIRVFSITPEELLVLRPHEVTERFIRAAQERNIRLLYVRPLLATPAGEAPFETNLGVVRTIAGDLREFGFTPMRSRPLPPLEVPAPLLWVSAAGALALVVLVLDGLAGVMGFAVGPRVWWGLLGLGLAVTIAAGLTPAAALWRQLLALGVAVAGAAGATVWALPRLAPAGGPRHSGRDPAGRWAAGWLTLLRALGLAVVAGVFVAALLSQWAFMLAFSTFLGVKAAHVAPVVLVALWLGFDRGTRRSWRDTLAGLRDWINQPLRLGSALAVLAVGLAGVMLLARTGNVSLPLLGAEQQLRSVLEQVLVARPRTKEFLIGYPALVLAGTAASLGWRKVALLFALVGTIGTAGAINSFSHLHTPLLYTMWRTGNALMLGAAIALPAVVVLRWIARRMPPF